MGWKKLCFVGWLPALLAVSSLWGQTITLSGSVRDLNTHRPIRHVNIYLENQSTGTTSDAAGRFRLQVTDSHAVIIFRHIAYEILKIRADSLAQQSVVYLQPRVIVMPDITVRGEGETRPAIENDLPQVYAVLDARRFEIRGYVDAGDLLRADQSVQVEEDLSGKKTVGMRGGNPDELIVLYNGVKLNNTFDNVFDFSLINTEDIQQFEIVKGSNTALYGPEAFSGVINVVPKIQLDYNLRFLQRFGTYRAGTWGLQLNPQGILWNSNRLKANYSYQRGKTRRFFAGGGEANELLNSATHHSAMFSYRMGSQESGDAPALSGMFLDTGQDYSNRRDRETLNRGNRLFSLRYTGRLSVLQALEASLAYKNLQETQTLRSSAGFLDRDIDDRSLFFNLQNRFNLRQARLLVGYQFQGSRMDYQDRRQAEDLIPLGFERARLLRRHHGFVAIARLPQQVNSGLLQNAELGASLRYDIVSDRQEDAVFRSQSPDSLSGLQVTPFHDHRWRETTVKFSVQFSGVQHDLALRSFLLFGINAKFPTPFQQISPPNTLNATRRTAPNLAPEKNRSLEMGFTLMRQLQEHPSVYGWSATVIYFQNHYDNKFRLFAVPGLPVAFYDNVADARISGFELTPTVYFLRKKVAVSVGLSRYFISERAAFPFKSDLKRTLQFSVDHAGYSLQALWFYEGRQVGWLRSLDAGLVEVTLPEYSNLDLHLSKTFEISRLKFFINFSGRNLLNDSTVQLEGLALRDRRIYLTVGAEY